MTSEFGTSYFGVRDIKHVQNDLERFSANGLNGILHTFSERDQRYYRDTTREIVRASRDQGFKVYVNPWGVGRVFGGEALSEFPSRFPDHTQQLSSGERAPAACLNSPRFREFMRRWIEDAASLGPDLIFWDEPHWYTPEWREQHASDEAWTCTCQFCQKQFEEHNDRQFPDQLTDGLIGFREQCILDFLDDMMKTTGQHDVENAVCVKPELGGDDVLSNWDTLASHDQLDVLATTPYWAFHNKEPESFVRRWSERIIGLADEHGLTSQIWIQGFSFGDDPVELDKHRTAVEVAHDCNPDSLFIWGWDGCRVISSIAPDDPDNVWSIFLDSIQTM